MNQEAANPRFKKGDRISLEEWDKYERPCKRLGKATVTALVKARCQTGWMVEFITDSGVAYKLDQDWITPLLI